MATEYNTIYNHVKHRPSRKSMMVCTPFYMYRIETNEFEHGLNFFQKVILKFKARPGTNDQHIANYTGLDSRLVGIVVGELQAKQLINEHGALSLKGKEKLSEIDGLVVNSGKKKIGYVFKYVNQDKLYQYYVNQVLPADTLQESSSLHPKIVTGTKGDGQDFTDLPFYLDEALNSKLSHNRPSERDVLQLIQNSSRKGVNIEEDENKSDKLSNQLSIRFLNDQPEIVWACTYIYLHQNEDETYEPDWRVLDPFGYGDNVALKFYITNSGNKRLLDSIQNKFADAKTFGGKILSDYNQQINKLTEERLLSDFSFGLNNQDENLQLYLRTIIKNLIIFEDSNFEDINSSVSFILNLQKILENVLQQDREKRVSIYTRIESKYSKKNPLSLEKKRDTLAIIFQTGYFTKDFAVYKSLLKMCDSSNNYSLKGYLFWFIISFHFDPNFGLYEIFKNRIDIIFEIANLRNENSHGATSNFKVVKPLSKEQIEVYYAFLKSFINDFIKIN